MNQFLLMITSIIGIINFTFYPKSNQDFVVKTQLLRLETKLLHKYFMSELFLTETIIK